MHGIDYPQPSGASALVLRYNNIIPRARDITITKVIVCRESVTISLILQCFFNRSRWQNFAQVWRGQFYIHFYVTSLLNSDKSTQTQSRYGIGILIIIIMTLWKLRLRTRTYNHAYNIFCVDEFRTSILNIWGHDCGCLLHGEINLGSWVNLRFSITSPSKKNNNLWLWQKNYKFSFMIPGTKRNGSLFKLNQ
jgi:hypothetical protein